MTHVEQSLLADVYQILNGDHVQQTSYILQFFYGGKVMTFYILWTIMCYCLRGDFDIVGLVPNHLRASLSFHVSWRL